MYPSSRSWPLKSNRDTGKTQEPRTSIRRVRTFPTGTPAALYFPTFFAFVHRAFCAAVGLARPATLIFRLPGETGRICFARSIL